MICESIDQAPSDTEKRRKAAREAEHRYRAKHAEKLLAKRISNRVELRAANKRWRDLNRERLLGKAREWYRKNRAQVLAATKKYQALNKEKLAEAGRKWTQKNKAKKVAYNAEYRASHKLEIAQKIRACRQKRLEHYKRVTEKYRISHREIYAESARRRRTREVKWASHSAILAVYAKAKELTAATGIRHEVDHVIPLQGKNVSGLHVETNLRVLTREQNRRKSRSFAA